MLRWSLYSTPHPCLWETVVPEHWNGLDQFSQLHVERANGHVTIALRSDIDMMDLPRLREFCEYVLTTPHESLTIVLNFTDVTYLSTAGLRVVEDFFRRLQLGGARVRVIAPNGSLVRRLLDILGPDTPLTNALEDNEVADGT
jgi:anti-anti-sigma factor